MKNVAKSSAVRVDEGRGGLRREVLKSMRIVNFVVIGSHFSSRGISREGREEGLIKTKVSRIFPLAPLPLCTPEFRTMFAENIR